MRREEGGPGQPGAGGGKGCKQKAGEKDGRSPPDGINMRRPRGPTPPAPTPPPRRAGPPGPPPARAAPRVFTGFVRGVALPNVVL